MPSKGTICSLLLLSTLWVDLAMAGSSFLSPEHQKAPQRKESKKPPAKLKPRALDSELRAEARDQAEDEREIRFSTPFDISVKLSGAQYRQHGQALEQLLRDILGNEAGEALANK
ncbi:appetite-regulating hormone [Ctenodactylus gundi]